MLSASNLLNSFRTANLLEEFKIRYALLYPCESFRSISLAEINRRIADFGESFATRQLVGWLDWQLWAEADRIPMSSRDDE